jgi:hypothetical protein
MVAQEEEKQHKSHSSIDPKFPYTPYADNATPQEEEKQHKTLPLGVNLDLNWQGPGGVINS